MAEPDAPRSDRPSPSDRAPADLPQDLASQVEHLARGSGLAADEVFASAVKLAAGLQLARSSGTHLGVVGDSTRLDTELTNAGGLVGDLLRRLKPDEHHEERRARLRAEQRTALLEDIKGVVLFAALLIAVTGFAGLCAWFALFSRGLSAETQRWAQTMLAAIVSGAVSFLVGRKVGGK